MKEKKAEEVTEQPKTFTEQIKNKFQTQYNYIPDKDKYELYTEPSLTDQSQFEPMEVKIAKLLRGEKIRTTDVEYTGELINPLKTKGLDLQEEQEILSRAKQTISKVNEYQKELQKQADEVDTYKKVKERMEKEAVEKFDREITEKAEKEAQKTTPLTDKKQ